MKSKILLGVSTLALGYGIPVGAQTVSAPSAVRAAIDELAAGATVLAQASPPQPAGQAAAGATEPAPKKPQTMQEVVVTAERRTVNVQKTALSVSVINGDEIAERGSSSVSQVLAGVPGVQVQGVENGTSSNGGIAGGGGPPLVSLRGLGTDGPNKSSASAFYTDGVLWQGGGGEFFDISRVEVLRGPQGTLYGRGATGGAINVITNNPTQKLEGEARLQLGTNNHVGIQAILNTPIADSLAMRIGVNQAKHNGYLNNGQSDQDDVNVRLKLLYKPSTDFSLLVGGTVYRSSSQGAGQVATLRPATPDPTAWTTDRPPGGASATIDYKKLYAQLDWDLGPVVLTYIPAFQTTDSMAEQFGGGAFSATVAPVNQAAKVQTYHPYDRTQTHELRLSSPKGAGLTWNAGLYYYDNTYRTEFRSAASAAALPAAFPSLQIPSQTSIAAYGEATYAFSPTLHATLGVRETKDDIKTSTSTRGAPLVDFSTSTSHFDWKARLDANLSADSLLYGMVSTGYRPGGYINGQAYANEVVQAYEVGSKNRFGDSLTMNAAAFYYDYSGFQSPQSGFVGVFPNGTVQTVVLSAPAKLYGLDVELTAHLTPDDKISFTGELLKGLYTGNIVGTIPGTAAPSTFLTDGHSLAHIPKYSLFASYAHTFDLADGSTLTGQFDVHRQAASLTDFDVRNYPVTNPFFNQSAWTEINASLNYASPSGKYTVSLYGKNLTDKIHKLQVNDDFSNPANTRFTSFVNAPRTFGVILSTRF